jgi:hypothetical protein
MRGAGARQSERMALSVPKASGKTRGDRMHVGLIAAAPPAPSQQPRQEGEPASQSA